MHHRRNIWHLLWSTKPWGYEAWGVADDVAEVQSATHAHSAARHLKKTIFQRPRLHSYIQCRAENSVRIFLFPACERTASHSYAIKIKRLLWNVRAIQRQVWLFLVLECVSLDLCTYRRMFGSFTAFGWAIRCCGLTSILTTATATCCCSILEKLHAAAHCLVLSRMTTLLGA